MLTYLRRLSDERNSLTALANSLSERAATDERDLTAAERDQMRGWQERCATLDEQIAEHNSQVASQRAWATLQSQMEHDDTTDTTVPQRRAGSPERTTSWGETFVESDAFRSFSGRGSSDQVDVPFDMRAAITTGLYPLPHADWVGPADPQYPTPLLDVVHTERVSANAVDWVRFAPNPPSEAGVVAEGDLKPEMLLTATQLSKTLLTYAHWKAITRQALEDIPRIQSIIEGRLRSGLSRAIESAIADELNTDAAIPVVPPGANMLASIRVAMGTVQANGYQPNAVLLNPADWASIDLALMAGTLNGPVINNSAFGIRFISSNEVTVGEAFVGDFATAVTVFDRGVASVFLTDSHADYFLRNQLVILGETRALPAIVEPTALAHVEPAGP